LDDWEVEGEALVDSQIALDTNPQTDSGIGVQSLLRSQLSAGRSPGAFVGIGEIPSMAIIPTGVTSGPSHGTATALHCKERTMTASEATIVGDLQAIVDIEE
jgi:hypothetical protein